MLNGRWVRFRAGQDGRCVPLLLDPDREDNAALAEALAGYLRGMGGRPRTEVEEGLEPLVKGEGRAKVARGLAEVLLERCEFEQAGELDPVAVREALFSRAAQRFPVGTREGMTLRGEILADAAAALGSTPAALEAALFADLKGEQRLTAAPPWTGEELLLRYNAAQVQALLLRAESLTVTLSAPPPARVRQLVRYLRFFELLHSVSAAEGTVVFSVDGPASVLEGGRRYGLQMARFFPALLLQERFVAEARIRWPGKRKRLDLVLEPSPRLRSWYPDTGAWIPREITELADRLAAAAGPGWEVRPAEEVVPLGGQTLFVPDLVLAGPRGRGLRLEVLWPHRHRGLGDYLDAVLLHAPLDTLVCVVKPGKRWLRRVLQAEDAGGGRVLHCARSVPVGRVLERASGGRSALL